MGDSFIEATQVSYPDSFVGRLAKYGSARTVVRNFGVTSYSPIFYVLQWRHHVKRFRPTHVFVLLFSNDPDTGGARTEVIFPDAEAQAIALRQQLGAE